MKLFLSLFAFAAATVIHLTNNENARIGLLCAGIAALIIYPFLPKIKGSRK